MLSELLEGEEVSSCKGSCVSTEGVGVGWFCFFRLCDDFFFFFFLLMKALGQKGKFFDKSGSSCTRNPFQRKELRRNYDLWVELSEWRSVQRKEVEVVSRCLQAIENKDLAFRVALLCLRERRFQTPANNRTDALNTTTQVLQIRWTTGILFGTK